MVEPIFLYVVTKRNEEKTSYIFDQQLQLRRHVNMVQPDFIQGSTFMNNEFWIYSPQGAFVIDTLGVIQNNGIPYFEKSSISSVMKDRQNNYWISTTNEGIFLVPDFDTKLYRYESFVPGRIEKSNDGFLVASQRGELIELDYSLRKKRKISSDPAKSEIYFMYCDTLTDDTFYSSKGFRKISDYDSVKTVFSDIAIKDICIVDHKYYAIAASGFAGLMLRNTDDSDSSSVWDTSFQTYIKDDYTNFAALISKIRGKSVVYDSHNKIIYLAASTGLFKITPDSVTEIKLNEKSFYASKLVLYNQQLVALSSKGNLYQILANEKFELLNQKVQLENFEIRLLKAYGAGIFFLSKRAIHWFDWTSRRHTLIETFISPREINDYVLHGNQILVLTNSGIITLNLENKSHQKSAPIFSLNYMEIEGKVVDYSNQIELNYSENDISINFSVLDFGKVTQASVYYRLSANALWEKIPAETRTLRFASLAPDEYQLEFKVNDELQTEAIKFIIHPPVLETVLVSCLVCACHGAVVVYLLSLADFTSIWTDKIVA
jgi:hypothetical protein